MDLPSPTLHLLPLRIMSLVSCRLLHMYEGFAALLASKKEELGYYLALRTLAASREGLGVSDDVPGLFTEKGYIEFFQPSKPHATPFLRNTQIFPSSPSNTSLVTPLPFPPKGI